MLATHAVRLLALFAFAWIAYRDYQTRTVPNQVWRPLAILGIVLIVVDVATGYATVAVNAAVALVLLAGVSYLYRQLGEWGGADTQAMIVIALLFPVAPTGAAPVLAVFPVTVFLNSMLLAGALTIPANLLDDGTLPFLVPVFGGLVVGVTVGDMLLTAMSMV